jgi:hypothetical protein
MACPQTIVQLYKGLMKVYTNQSGVYEGEVAVVEHRDKDQAAGLEIADACAVWDKTGEFETAVYGEIMQIKQDRIIPIFRCQVIKTIVSQYCGIWSSAGITRYIRFRELKALEDWECRQVRAHGKVVIGGRKIQTTIGATMSHAMFLSRTMDDDSNCEAEIISFPNGKTLSGQAAQGLYEITLREEFARMNELTGSINLSSGIQARVSNKSLVDSLEGTVVGNMTLWPAPRR